MYCPSRLDVRAAAQVGASPGWGGLTRLCSIVGRQEALRLLGTSARCLPDELIQNGLADALYDGQKLGDTEAGLAFLEPFVERQQYGGSVAAMKSAVSAVCDSTVVQDGHDLTPEAAAFQMRWCGPDNLEALAKTVKS